MNNVINWFEIPVADMDRAVAFYEPVMQVSLRRETMDCAELAVFPHQDPAPGGALAKFEGIAPSAQGAIIYLHTDHLAATLDRIASAEAGALCAMPQEDRDAFIRLTGQYRRLLEAQLRQEKKQSESGEDTASADMREQK